MAPLAARRVQGAASYFACSTLAHHAHANPLLHPVWQATNKPANGQAQVEEYAVGYRVRYWFVIVLLLVKDLFLLRVKKIGPDTSSPGQAYQM